MLYIYVVQTCALFHDRNKHLVDTTAVLYTGINVHISSVPTTRNNYNCCSSMSRSSAHIHAPATEHQHNDKQQTEDLKIKSVKSAYTSCLMHACMSWLIIHTTDDNIATPLRYQRQGGGKYHSILRISYTPLGARVPAAPNSSERPPMFVQRCMTAGGGTVVQVDTRTSILLYLTTSPTDASFQHLASQHPSTPVSSIQHPASSSYTLASSLEDSNTSTDGSPSHHRDAGTTAHSKLGRPSRVHPLTGNASSRGERLPVGVAIRLPITEQRER